jgi:hypothetical protein
MLITYKIIHNFGCGNGSGSGNGTGGYGLRMFLNEV